MTKLELKAHKDEIKKLPVKPIFKQLKRKKLPKPFDKVGGANIFSTDLMPVSEQHVVVMLWKDGQVFTDRQFYAYLFYKSEHNDLIPLFEFHWHPSHKGFHCKLPCSTSSDYKNRLLPGAPELALKTQEDLDPKEDEGRAKLILEFCKLCKISLPSSDSQPQLDLWQ